MEDWIIPRKGSVPFHLSIEMEDGSKGYAVKKEGTKQTRKKCRITRLTINPQELRVMQITTPGRDAYPGSRFTGTLITHHMERNPCHVPDALDVGRNSKNYWT